MYLFGIKSWGVVFSFFGWLIYTFHSTLALKSFPLSSSLPSFSSSSLPSSHISPVKVFQTCCVILNITNFNGQENYHVWIGDWKRCANLCGDEHLIFILVTESKTDEKKKKTRERSMHLSYVARFSSETGAHLPSSDGRRCLKMRRRCTIISRWVVGFGRPTL